MATISFYGRIRFVNEKKGLIVTVPKRIANQSKIKAGNTYKFILECKPAIEAEDGL